MAGHELPQSLSLARLCAVEHNETTQLQSSLGQWPLPYSALSEHPRAAAACGGQGEAVCGLGGSVKGQLEFMFRSQL